MSFSFVSGWDPIGVVFQEKYLAKNKPAFIILKKTFDKVPHSVIWWSLRKLGVYEWCVIAIQTLYRGAISNV